MRFFPKKYGNLFFENLARDREKRGRSVVFKTGFDRVFLFSFFFFFFFCYFKIFFFCFFFFFFLRIDTFAFFHSDGKMPCVRHDLKIILRGLQMDLSHNLTMTLWEKCPNAEFFLVRIFPNEYREIRSVSPYSVRMR